LPSSEHVYVMTGDGQGPSLADIWNPLEFCVVALQLLPAVWRSGVAATERDPHLDNRRDQPTAFDEYTAENRTDRMLAWPSATTARAGRSAFALRK
jgi:hypothetical protein